MDDVIEAGWLQTGRSVEREQIFLNYNLKIPPFTRCLVSRLIDSSHYSSHPMTGRQQGLRHCGEMAQGVLSGTLWESIYCTCYVSQWRSKNSAVSDEYYHNKLIWRWPRWRRGHDFAWSSLWRVVVLQPKSTRCGWAPMSPFTLWATGHWHLAQKQQLRDLARGLNSARFPQSRYGICEVWIHKTCLLMLMCSWLSKENIIYDVYNRFNLCTVSAAKRSVSISDAWSASKAQVWHN